MHTTTVPLLFLENPLLCARHTLSTLTNTLEGPLKGPEVGLALAGTEGLDNILAVQMYGFMAILRPKEIDGGLMRMV